MLVIKAHLATTLYHTNRPQTAGLKKRQMIRVPKGTRFDDEAYIEKLNSDSSHSHYRIKKELAGKDISIKAIQPGDDLIYFYLTCLKYPIKSRTKLEFLKNTICNVCLLNELFARNLQSGTQTDSIAAAYRNLSEQVLKKIEKRFSGVRCHKQIVVGRLQKEKEKATNSFRNFIEGENSIHSKGFFSNGSHKVLHLEKTTSLRLLGGQVSAKLTLKLRGTKDEIAQEVKAASKRERLFLPYGEFFLNLGILDLDVEKVF